jgi:hypothetical protein
MRTDASNEVRYVPNYTPAVGPTNRTTLSQAFRTNFTQPTAKV